MRMMFVHFNKDFRPRTLLSLSILDTILRNEGHETEIFDTSFYLECSNPHKTNLIKAGVYKGAKNLMIRPKYTGVYKDFKNRVEKFKPQLVGFSYYSVNEDIQEILFVQLRKDFKNIKIIAGGPVACINTVHCLDQCYIDMVCCGEGEELIKTVCKRVDDNENLRGIQGLWFKENGKIVSNGITNLTNINALPIVDYGSYDPIHINGLFNGRAYRMGHVEFTRGCPYNCSYCGSGSIRKKYMDTGQIKYIRHKDPKIAVKEYKALKERYDLEMFYFVDGTFTSMPIKVLEKLAYLYKKEIGLPFIALVHPNTIKEDTARLLKLMGCIHVSIGIESGIETYRNKILNRKMSNEQIVRSISLLQKNGIKVSAYNMIGLPGMDRNHIFKTIELNRKAKPHTSIVGIFIPFPDNELTKSLVKQKIININEINLENGLTPTIKIEEMNKEEIVGLFNTFNLYVKLPKLLYPLIRILEKEGRITRFIRKILYGVIK